MSRGTFANIRLVNKLMGSQTGPKTVHFPSEKQVDIFDAAEIYKQENVPVVLIAGKEYGSGSSRDWAAKGPWMLGIKAIIAESYERIHRSNLIGMGIVPFQFLEGQSAETLNLTGKEKFTILLDQELSVKKIVDVEVSCKETFKLQSLKTGLFNHLSTFLDRHRCQVQSFDPHRHIGRAGLLQAWRHLELHDQKVPVGPPNTTLNHRHSSFTNKLCQRFTNYNYKPDSVSSLNAHLHNFKKVIPLSLHLFPL